MKSDGRGDLRFLFVGNDFCLKIISSTLEALGILATSILLRLVGVFPVRKEGLGAVTGYSNSISLV